MQVCNSKRPSAVASCFGSLLVFCSSQLLLFFAVSLHSSRPLKVCAKLRQGSCAQLWWTRRTPPCPEQNKTCKHKIDAGVPTYRGNKLLRIQTFALGRTVLETESWQTRMFCFCPKKKQKTKTDVGPVFVLMSKKQHLVQAELGSTRWKCQKKNQQQRSLKLCVAVVHRIFVMRTICFNQRTQNEVFTGNW